MIAALVTALLARKRLVFALLAILTLAGAFSWVSMPRQEDPKLPGRWASVVVPFPGADAATVERLIVDPVEEELGEVDELLWIRTLARGGVAIIELELDGSIYDVDAAWKEVEDALDRAALPAAALDPILDTRMNDPESVVLAVTGSDDRLALADAAERVREELLMVPGTSRARVPVDVGEQVTITLREEDGRALGLDPRTLAAALQGRNTIVPGGTVQVGSQTLVVRPASELSGFEELQQTPVLLPGSGAAVPLSTVATVERTPADPVRALARLDGEPAVVVTAIPREAIDLVAWGEDVRERLEIAEDAIAPLQLSEVAFQPDHVDARIGSLSLSLLLGILIVAAVLVAFMGLRVGLVVASVVPVVALSSVAVFALGGGVLHQISIAALVLALGLLVDNAIVVVESVQQKLNAGRSPEAAASESVRELLAPLAAATGTTVAAFVPMLLAGGSTGDFTRALPIVVLLTLTLSYVVAVAATPAVAARLLRPRTGAAATGRIDRLADRLSALAIARPFRVLAAAGLVVAAAGLGARGVTQEFFPPSDRPTVVVTIELPEGSHLSATDAAARQLEEALDARDDVRSVATFVGQGAPRFYYNIPSRPNAPHLAQLVVQTDSAESSEELVPWLRAEAADRIPEPRVLVERLQQGPPVGAPVQVRLVGTDLDDLAEAAGTVAGILRTIPGAIDVQDDLGPGTPTLVMDISDVDAGRQGLSRADVALAVLGRTHGLDAGELRSDGRSAPIVVRTGDGERSSVDDLATAGVSSPSSPRPVPLMQVATTKVEWTPSSLHHHNRRRAVTVSAFLDEGLGFSAVLTPLKTALDSADLPAGVGVEYDGAARGSAEANGGMIAAVPVGLGLLLFFLLLEFNSFRRVTIVLATVPLAAVGVVPGLLLSAQPFGFMSLLGVIALLGIVVNNAIVLIDVVDRRRREGAELADAIAASVRLRIRPILLTAATTVAGLLPLALSPGSMWPPLAWAMISGLVASTALTLLVVPSLYALAFGATTLRLPSPARRPVARPLRP